MPKTTTVFVSREKAQMTMHPLWVHQKEHEVRLPDVLIGATWKRGGHCARQSREWENDAKHPCGCEKNFALRLFVNGGWIMLDDELKKSKINGTDYRSLFWATAILLDDHCIYTEPKGKPAHS